MTIPRSAAAIAAIIAITLTGCAQPDPNAEPTYTCTQSTGTPQPCYKAEHDLQIKEDKLYAEAEAVYRKFFAEEERIYRAGGIDKPSPVLLETTSGEFLTGSMKVYRDLRKYHAAFTGGTYKLAWIRKVPQEQRAGSPIALHVCTDASTVMTSAEGSRPEPGGKASETVFFKPIDGHLKAAAFKSKVVQEC